MIIKRRLPDSPLRIAMIGTRRVLAAYSGFETTFEEIGRRLSARGHQVVVYCRTGGERRRSYLGMRLIHLPAIRSKSLGVLGHTLLSAPHSLVHKSLDVAFVLDAANAPFLPIIQLRRVPVVVHLYGLDLMRDKRGKKWTRVLPIAEQLSVRWASALIANAPGIAEYYAQEFGVETELLTLGAQVLADSPSGQLEDLGLVPGAFHLVVARFEPENHVGVIVEGFAASSAASRLVVVGSAPFPAEYTDRISPSLRPLRPRH